MSPVPPSQSHVVIRPLQYRDLEAVERLGATQEETGEPISLAVDPDRPLRRLKLRPWYGVLRLLSVLLHPMEYIFCATSGEANHDLQGLIRVSPFNKTRSTWRVDQVIMPRPAAVDGALESDAFNCPIAPPPLLKSDVGSSLLRYCLATIWEARTWILEVNVNDKDLLALYRQNGFQPLAHMTYWAIAPQALQELGEREPDLPNLLPVSNADSQVLYQLDTASMPPLVRQVFDRHVSDFKTSLFGSLLAGVKNWLSRTEVVSGYVFESQRKAAIGYFSVRLCRDGSHPHRAQLTVHPAYTWLYPELIGQMARIAQDVPAQSLHLASSDYQSEREEYLERVGATRVAHTLMMSRSVWHKLREAKTSARDALQLTEMLQGLKPARNPIPSRFESVRKATQKELSSDLSDTPPEGPCC